MKLCNLLSPNLIIPELTGKTKDEIINELVDLFNGDPRVTDLNSVREAVHEREKIMSTGVGKGFAIPHAKSDGVTEIIAAFGRTSHPVDFNALDMQPVNLIFLLIGKENLVGPHIKLLSRISRMMNKDEFRDNLSKAATVEEICKIFEEEEKNYLEIT